MGKISLSETSRAILLTYCDALTRQQNTLRWSTEEVIAAMDRFAYESALDMVVEMATAQGADAGLLLSWMTKLCADWKAKNPVVSQPEPSAGEIAAAKIMAPSTALALPASKNGENGYKKGKKKEEPVLTLVDVLHTKAARNARNELNKVWDSLDHAYDPGPGEADVQGGIGPSYSALTATEEMFYIRNKIVAAIFEKSLAELRRSLVYAMAFGVDPQSIEIESAYRDALASYEQAEGFSSELIRVPLDRGDWWTVLDGIVAVALLRGVDANALTRMIGTYQSRSSRALFELPQTKEETIAAV